ncbi:hypothetical protein [Chloroflexus sp.]|uniref:hypothetical protein n=1 Tax=Chloroflexus sp. TaxID=1904827 RepID=UPI00298F0F5B|nr:hypothetical protein [Chloroflexus sp.]MDW8405320.1 hypothetical protein [Chloroflexus sp.]
MSANLNNEFEIAPGVKNTEWKELNLSLQSDESDWRKATEMFRKRLGRFTEPVRALMGHKEKKVNLYSGFAIIALDCLLIETLQSFREGRSNPEGRRGRGSRQSTREMFVRFLTTRPRFKFSDEEAEIFYDHFRNGILHQGEIKSSGRIKKETKSSRMIKPSEDDQSLIVYRNNFHRAVEEEIENYINELINGKDNQIRKNFIKKMNEICRCNPNTAEIT